MLLTDIAAAAAFRCRRDVEGPAHPQKSTLAQVLSQGRLHYRRQRGRRLLSLQVVLHSLSYVVGESHGGPLHTHHYSTTR